VAPRYGSAQLIGPSSSSASTSATTSWPPNANDSLRSTSPTCAASIENWTRPEIRIRVAVIASGTTLCELHGVGPVVAAIILGHVHDIARFRTRAQFASYNATAPIEASSANRERHRLNQRGNRHLNHAIHMIAVTQVAHDTPGRAYYLLRQAEGETRKEALRALKRRISDAVWRQLQIDARATG
jgi:transposase